ncbi:biotin transporter BioY [Ponticoccus sp. SC2-23]|uniref:biotin transporter BioY n=1 Tax=Alexandriicola marinus TaxID=2081710 RepID=UPI000FD90AF2|nr:biotin transporter BioY [Alexandriicola marinus]MBM1222363.1 biotin transporter BioY [Ponticoccus sp. SC6-9]MBM1224476.1 biotin transporter BioY [Ponticoccus sp. SC6-15]MBM1229744.1 biotin transporter BioY [Ponticoccus sp. SC6-38]MBM1233442.1 biotin transporter BioY [Ponticoccus sp. SC6-45]MBM1236608.1 biotin transporter BioY [Ponticoccus sp. SC6-49]MBM1244652.1 biotin transporter BioY [Ponticoccus sp. SC2-64]MBM1246966.1 biotin transporter BioY [Ponticoccus sp. SC6-42]MBM1251444.1 bioti
MSILNGQPVLIDTFGARDGARHLIKQAALVALGVLAIAIAAQIRVPMWPVPVTMQTFAVLTVGAAFGARLGLVTLLAYLALGAMGAAVFTGEGAGLAYMMGPTGGYLLGFAVAAWAVGALARRGWSQSVTGMIGALLIGNAIIYAFGLPWMAYLFLAERGAEWVLQWGMTNFLLGDAIKLMLAALLIPGLWTLMGKARG